MNWEYIKNHKRLLIVFGIFLLAVYILIHVVYAKYVGISKDNNGASNQSGQVIPGEIVVEKIDVDDLVGNIKSEYKQSDSFRECIGFNTGVKTCLREEINKKVAESGDTKYCADLTTQADINSCVQGYANQKAREMGDIKYCADLTDASAKQNCTDEALIAKAKKEDDISICNGVSEFQVNACKENIVFEKVRKSLKISDCDVLEDISKDMCKNEVQFAIDEAKFQKEEEARRLEEQKRFEKEQVEFEKNNPAPAPAPDPVAEEPVI